MSGKAVVDKESSRRGMNRACMVILVTAIFVAPVFLIVTPASVSASATWYATDLGTEGYAYTVPTGINVHDQVSAWLDNSVDPLEYDPEAVVYDPDLGSWTTLPNLGEYAWTEGINDAGEIVGVSRSSPITAVQGVYWPSSSSSGPIIKLLPLAGEPTSEAYGLNDVQRAVGASAGPYSAAVVWDLNPLATDIPAQEIGSVAGMDDTTGVDINNNGAIVGYANLRTAPEHRQAFYCEGIGYPIQSLIPLSGGVDGSDSVAHAINDAGLIVGYSRDTNDLIHAVIWTSPDANPVDLGLASPSYANDVNDDGTIVGYAAQPDGNSGFIYHNYPNGPLEFLERPSGATAYNNPVAINDLGHVVSCVEMSDYDMHAFLWTPNAPPVAKFTVEGIGILTTEFDASGSFDTDGSITGYVWDFGDGATGSGMTISHTYMTTGTYTVALTVTDNLGLTGSTTAAIDVASQSGAWNNLGNIPGYDYIHAMSINTDGQVLAVADNGGTEEDYKAIVWDPLVSQWTELYGSGSSAAYDINEAGDIVGYIVEPVNHFHKAVMWTADGLMVDLASSAGEWSSVAFSCSNRNPAGIVQVAGWAAIQQMILWTVDTSLPTPTVVATSLTSPYGCNIVPRGINKWGAVVGIIQQDPEEAFYYDKYVGFKILPKLDENGPALAFGINDAGKIVGHSWVATTSRAVVWDSYDTTPSVLDTDIGGSVARAINDKGLVVGRSGNQAVLWDTPRPGYPRVELGKATGMMFSDACGVNSLGQVVGVSGGMDGLGRQVFLWTPPPNSPPKASFTVDWVSSTPTVTVRLDGSASFDTYGTIVGYAWDFGDGTPPGAGMTVYHTFTTPGVYTVTLTVTDDEGLTGSFSQAVDGTVEQAPLEEVADLKEDIAKIKASDAVKQELTALAVKAEQLIESRRSHAYDQAASILLTLVTKIEGYTFIGEIDPGEGWDLTCEANLIMALLTNQVMINGVPCYEWYHGCGPTAVGMIVGYWDTMRFSDLVPGDVSVQNDIANSMIASSGHIEDYALFPHGWDVEEDIPGHLTPDASDNNYPGEPHGDDCIADSMHTSFSQDQMAYGQSLVSKVIDGFVEYVSYVSPDQPGTTTPIYSGTAKQIIGKSLSWSYITRQVKQQRPMAFTVDIDGDKKTDHLVTVIGYCSIGKAKLYAFYSTFDDTIWWANFELMKDIDTQFFGIYNAYEFNIVKAV